MAQIGALAELALNIGVHGSHHRYRISIRAGDAENFAVDRGQNARVLIGLTPDHHPIHMLKLYSGFVQRFDAAVDRHRKVGEIALQLPDAGVIQRRDLAVLFWTQAGEPGFAGVNNKHLTLALAGDCLNEIAQKLIAVLVVNADTGFHRDRNRHHIAHRLDAVGHQWRIAHQASAKHPVLHAVGGAADVEVDLIIAARLGQLRALRQGLGIAAAELQSNRVLFFAIGQIVPFAVNNRPGGHHFGIQQRMPRQQPQEVAAVSVGPVEHRRDGEAVSRENR